MFDEQREKAMGRRRADTEEELLTRKEMESGEEEAGFLRKEWIEYEGGRMESERAM